MSPEHAEAAYREFVGAGLSQAPDAWRQMFVAGYLAASAGWRVHGLCDKHAHIGHFPPDVPSLNLPTVRVVCPWCERKGAR